MDKKSVDSSTESPTRLVFLEGAPSVGKMTVARELSKLTGYRSFHNHLSQDLAGAIYPEWTQRRFELVDKLRMTAFKDAAEHGTDLIFTYVYGGTPNEKIFLEDTIDTYVDRGGKVHFFNIFATQEAQEARVSNDTRKEFGKITDIEHLQKRMGAYARNPQFPYHFEGSFDTTTFSPEHTASQIHRSLELL